MSIFSSALLSVVFVLLGVNRIINIKRNTRALYEAVKFINSIKNNIRFLSMDYVNLMENAKKENYTYIRFEETVSITESVGEKIQKEFSGFIGKIGTTDEEGQLCICDEYIERFRELYNESVSKEKARINVVGAISVLCVVCVLVLGG